MVRVKVLRVLENPKVLRVLENPKVLEVIAKRQKPWSLYNLLACRLKLETLRKGET